MRLEPFAYFGLPGPFWHSRFPILSTFHKQPWRRRCTPSGLPEHS
jgi:hypothetical protein